MERPAVQMLIFGIVFVVLGLVWLIVKHERLPTWMQLKSLARYRVIVALLTIAVGAFMLATAMRG